MNYVRKGNHRLHILILFLILSFSGCITPLPSVYAYSRDGSKEYYKAMAYLYFNTSRGNYLRGRGYEEASKMTETERLEAALEHFENAERSRPSSSEEERISQSKMHVCNQLSLSYSKAGDNSKALETAEKAVKIKRNDPVLWLNLAYYQKAEGQKSEATYSYEQALDNRPDEKLKKRLTYELVQLYFDRAMTEDKDIMHQALRLIENGLYDDRDNTDLLSMKAKANYTLSNFDDAIGDYEYLQRFRNLTENEQTFFKEAKSRQASILKQGEVIEERCGFVISFDPEFDSSVSDKISRFLADAKDEISPVFGVNTKTRVNVYVHTAKEYSQIHGNRPIAGTAMLNRIDLRIADTVNFDTLKNTIYHEFTHYLVYVLAKNKQVPIWFNEGIAQYFEPEHNGKKQLSRGINFYKKNKMLSFDDIESIKTLDYESFYDAYTQSVFMIKYLIDLNGENRILSILEKTGNGMRFENAFVEVIGSSQKEYFGKYRLFLKEQLLEMRRKYVPKYKRSK